MKRVNPPEADPLDSSAAGKTGPELMPHGGQITGGDSMKSLMFAVLAAVGLSAAGVAQASAELAQKSGCMTCHSVDTKKMGPSFNDIAKKFKGQASAEADLVTKLKTGKGHPAVKTSDDDTKALVKWILAL
jgi:cytochrome c